MGVSFTKGERKLQLESGIIELPLKINSRAFIIKKLSHKSVWKSFLLSSVQSFALSQAEITSILIESAEGLIDLKSGETKASIAEKIASFIGLINEIYDPPLVAFDILSICGVILLISDTPLEEKIDTLFGWMSIDDKYPDVISADDFYLSLVSLELGISHALGKCCSSEAYIKNLSLQWLSLNRQGDNQKDTLTKSQFFELCTNRQQPVRQLLEQFAIATVKLDDDHDSHDAITASATIREPAAGDQWLANPPWIKTAEKMTPADCVRNKSKPDSSLTLEWVHGYRGYDCRNNVFYVDNTSALFHAAALGIVQSVSSPMTQTYFGEHGDDVISIAIHQSSDDSKTIIATGEIGKTPAIHLWQPGSLHSLACMRGYHTKGVSQLVFSNDGSILFSVGVDYTVAVYCTKIGEKAFGRQLGSAQGPKDKVLHCCNSGGVAGKDFVTCGDKHILFWKLTNNSPKSEPAKLGTDKNKMFLCCVSLPSGEIVVGTGDGELLKFPTFGGAPVRPSGSQWKSKTPHNKAVNALWSPPAASATGGEHMFLSGGKDGKVICWQWNEDLTIQHEITLSEAHVGVSPGSPLLLGARSVCLSPDGARVLVGSQACSVVEVELRSGRVLHEGRPIVCGHFKDELWGLAVRPPPRQPSAAYAPEFCTVGDDHYLRIWSLTSHSLLRYKDMGFMARACAYHPSGDIIAVGFGGRVGRATVGAKQKNDGMFRIYRAQTLEVMYEAQESKQWIQELKFSSDGALLAIGSHDDSIYIYSYANQFQRKAKFSKHNSFITHFDFSSDGRYLQSNCGAYELLFCDTTTGNQIATAAELKDVKWATWTCPLGWPVQGIWPPGADGTDINAVDRSHSGHLIATADDFGKVKIFRYPSVAKESLYCQYTGHSSHVMNVRWILDAAGGGEEYLLTVGGEDKCVFQWRNTGPQEDPAESGAVTSRGRASREAEEEEGGESVGNALDNAPAGGDEFMAVKPWLGAIVAPSAWTAAAATGSANATATATAKGKSTSSPNTVQFVAALGEFSSAHSKLHIKDMSPSLRRSSYNEASRMAAIALEKMSESGYLNSSSPDHDELELDWVHGYRGFDARNNVHCVRPPTGGDLLVYPAASLGVVLDLEKNTQRYFRGHTDDVLSMAVLTTAEGVVVATGQNGKGNTYVWDVPGLTPRATLQTAQKTVNMISFSRGDGRLLITLAEDNSVAVSDWRNQRLVTSVKGEPAPTYHIACCNTDPNVFLTCGDKHIRRWTLSGKNLNSVKVSTAGRGSPQAFLSATEFGGKWIVGCEDGSLYIIQGGSLSAVVKHNKAAADKAKDKKSLAVTAIFSTDTTLITASKDGSISVWTNSPEHLLTNKVTFTLESVASSAKLLNKSIQSICLSAMDTGSERLVIGTRGCELLLLDLAADGSASLSPGVTGGGGGVLTRGHFNDELWGVAAHPTEPIYATVGDDRTLRLWDVHGRKMLGCVALGTMARACAFHPAGNLIAVGFGGRVGRGKQTQDGILRLYFLDMSDLTASPVKLLECSDSKKWISELRFSPDGLLLAVGSHDDKIYIYSVRGEGKDAKLALKTKFSKHNSFITHFDFSSDGRYLQSNCGAYELLFCDTSTGNHITSATELKDVKWATWTCPLGWPVQGIWPPGADGTDINAVDRSHSGHLIATADDFGKVKIFRYPCVSKESQFLAFAGHSSHVPNVRWTVADAYLISVGGNDKCVFQWKHTMADMDEGSGGGTGGGAGGTHDHAVGSGNSRSAVALDEDVEDSEDVIANALDNAPAGGDEFMAVKPWLGAIRAPPVPQPVNAQAPAVAATLQWVHGYTSGTVGEGNVRVSSNLFYNAEDDPVFPAASLGVRLHRDPSAAGGLTQTFFTGHNDDVMCLAMSPDRRFVATGQSASHTSKGKASVHVWDATECRLLSSMPSCHQRAVVSLAFSLDGQKLLTVGQDNNYTHSIWRDVGGGWSRVQEVATQKSDQNTIMFSRWIPRSSNKDFHLISGGSASLHFWTLDGATLNKKQGRFGRKYKQQPLLCAASLQQKDGWQIVIGTSTGDLYIFPERECTNAIEKAHAGAVLSLSEVRLDKGAEEVSYIISGGRDHFIKVWNQALQPISVIDLSPSSIADASVGSVDFRFAGTDLVVLAGMYGGEIVELVAQKGDSNKAAAANADPKQKNMNIASAQPRVLLRSHFSGELWGLATHPTIADIVATAGDDATLRIWSISRNSLLGHVDLGWPARAVAWSPRGDYLAVGFLEAVKGGGGGKKAAKGKAGGKAKPAAVSDVNAHNGACHIYSIVMTNETVRLSKVAQGCESLATVSQVKFSPSGAFLAVAAHDRMLYRYRFTPSAKYPGVTPDSCFQYPLLTFSKHSSAVLHLDFTLDELYIQSSCQAYELLFSVAESSEQVTSASKLAHYNNAPSEGVPEEHWSSWTNILGWPVQGIWPPGADGSDINSVDRSYSNTLLATADDFGHVKLFRYPCVTENSKYVTCDGHSSHVTNVRWVHGDQHLISVGGNDKCIFVWSIKNL